jgi:hypothetical protein
LSPPSPPPPAWSWPSVCTRRSRRRRGDDRGSRRWPTAVRDLPGPNMLPVYRSLAERIGDRLGRPVELVSGPPSTSSNEAKPTSG